MSLNKTIPNRSSFLQPRSIRSYSIKKLQHHDFASPIIWQKHEFSIDNKQSILCVFYENSWHVLVQHLGKAGRIHNNVYIKQEFMMPQPDSQIDPFHVSYDWSDFILPNLLTGELKLKSILSHPSSID